MEKISRVFQKMTLKKALLTISAAILVIVTMLSVMTILTAADMRQEILNTRTITIKESGNHYKVGEYNLKDNEEGNAIYFSYKVMPENYTYGKLSSENQIRYVVVTFFMVALPILYVIVGAFVVVKLYYKMKLSASIEALRSGMEHISGYDLDFQIDYCSEDELGMLCGTFEEMRKELYHNNQKMWRMLQDRKALTASVSHDLRTPITVIKGYLEYMEKAAQRGQLIDEILAKTLQNMTQSTERLERYVDCIQDIQKMEDIEIEKSALQVPELLNDIEDDFTILAGQRQRSFLLNNRSKKDIIYTDKNMLFKILENLLNNALRFSESRITLTVAGDGAFIDFIVQDDGKGFDCDELQHATTLFYSSSAGKENFGIGLSICKILCEKLGGTLMISNHADGGACVAARVKTI